MLSRTLRQPLRLARPIPFQLRDQSPFLRSTRSYSADTVSPPEFLDENERKIFTILKDNLQPSKLEVQDVSGGCGSMYALEIESAQFKGLSMIKQHRLVNKILADEIKKWHGVRLTTKAP